MPFSMNNLARIPWQGLDTRPYTPGMFGGPVPMPDKPSYGPPTSPTSGPVWPGGGGGGPSTQPIELGSGGTGPDGVNWHTNATQAPAWNPQAQSPLASLPPNYWQSKAQQLHSGAGYTQPLDMAKPHVTTNTATSNPITQAMQSFQSNLRSQVPQQYQQYLPANFGF